MKIHFIAIGGSIMHNLAITLHKKGFSVTGSDDEIFDPANSRLKKYGLLPKKIGWNVNHIYDELDAIILGMHAKADNIELIKAKELGLKIYSFPEFVFEQSKAKKRIVIGGSHGKTTITSMLLHVLKNLNLASDYLVGAQLEGYETMVSLTDAEQIVLEGDEYLTSALDLRPKFHLYHPHIALLSGIAWDHINVFPTFENYLDQFRIFLNILAQDKGSLVYDSEDPILSKLVDEFSIDAKAYQTPAYEIDPKQNVMIHWQEQKWPVSVFGKHNLKNIIGAMLVAEQMGISNEKFLASIHDFTGAAKRLQLIKQNEQLRIFKDFAHAPSKVRATTAAVKDFYQKDTLIACLELHTYSSLNKDFLPQYKGSLKPANHKIVFFDNHALAIKKLPPISKEMIKEAFGLKELAVFNDAAKLEAHLKSLIKDKSQLNLLMMSSGNFGGINLDTLGSFV